MLFANGCPVTSDRRHATSGAQPTVTPRPPQLAGAIPGRAHIHFKFLSVSPGYNCRSFMFFIISRKVSFIFSSTKKKALVENKYLIDSLKTCVITYKKSTIVTPYLQPIVRKDDKRFCEYNHNPSD